MKALKSSKSLTSKKSGANAAVMKPQLTSLIDVMTILLVFLLKSFSTDGALISVSPEMNLAESKSRENPIPSLNIEITAETILVGGKAVARLENIERGDFLFIEAVYQGLLASHDFSKSSSPSGRITIQCDRSVDFSVLKKVMYTCGKAALKDFSLLVLEKA